MNTLLLQPTDVLFFRDGRPMSGSLAGHGAAWPLPTVTNAALHAALWRSGISGHKHAHHGSNGTLPEARVYGSLVTAGPFPVQQRGANVPPLWYFPRPLDLLTDTLAPTLMPAKGERWDTSSLPKPLNYAVAPPLTDRLSKDTAAKAWLSAGDYSSYIAGSKAQPAAACDDRDFSDAESTIGIGLDPSTGTQDGESFYSAHYLRLRDHWRLGLCAATSEQRGKSDRDDFIPDLIKADGHVVVGGQQRLCTAQCDKNAPVPLPHGETMFTADTDGKVRIKWVLLSPAIFPAIEANGTTHTGGWLPSWVRQTDGAVQLRAEAKPRGADDSRETRDQWRARVQAEPIIQATLVAALVPKPLPITGWSLGDETLGSDGIGGAKSTHLAVPAGAVYYFEVHANAELRTSAEQEAKKLANALNWHSAVVGDPLKDYTMIRNRRSTLLGEKGFGLGVCGTWQFHLGH